MRREIFKKIFAVTMIVTLLFSNLLFEVISSSLTVYQESRNIVDKFWNLKDDKNVVDNLGLYEMAQRLKTEKAQAANVGQMTWYLHKEPSDYNETYNSMTLSPPEASASTASGVTSTVTNANPPTALCESSNNTGETFTRVGAAGAAATARCLASFISSPMGAAVSIATTDATFAPIVYIVDGATTGTSTTYVYLYKLCAAAGGDCAGAGSLVRFKTFSSTTDPGTTVTQAAITAAVPDVNVSFTAADRIAMIVSRTDSSTTAINMVFDYNASYLSRLVMKYTTVAPNKPSLAGAKDDDFTTGLATTACSTGGVAYNTKWTCLQGSAASTAGDMNAGNTAGTTGDTSDWLWLRNKATATTAVPSNFGTTPSNTFLYQSLNAGYGNGTVRAAANSSLAYTIGATSPTTPFSHSGLALWASNSDFLEVQVYSDAAKGAANTAKVALFNQAGIVGTAVSINSTISNGLYNRVWVGFQNTGGTYQAQYSTDGTTWNNVGTATAHAEFSRVGLNAFTKVANPISMYSGAFEWFQHTFAAPAATVTATTTGTQTTNIDAGATGQYLGGAWRFQQNSGSADTITALTISETGTVNANLNVTNATIRYSTANAGTCTYLGTETIAKTGVSFDATDKAAFTALTSNIPLTISPNYTCVYLIIDAGANAVGGNTIEPEITAAADFTLSGGSTKAGTYPVALGGATTIRPNVTDATDSALADGGRNGDTFTITGTGFGTACGSISAQVAGLALTCNSANNTTISATVPSAQTTTFGGAGASGLLVTVGGTADDARLTYYVYPNITSVSSTGTDAARELESITLNGTRFDTNANPGTVNFTGGFGSVSASVTTWGDTGVTVTVPAAIADNIYTGDITLTRAAATGSKTDLAYGGNTFRILPKIASTSPVNLKGGRGDTISITGDHLCQSGTCPTSFSAANSVNFNSGSVTSGSSTWTDTSIPSIVIPGTAIDGNLNITSNTTYTSNNLTYDIKFAPSTPTNGVPAGQADITLNPTLNSSAFSDGTDADTHLDSEWQIDEEGTFVTSEWSETLSSANVSVTVNTTNGTFAGLLAGQTSLACGKTYSFRERHKDNGGVTSQEWSGWSTASTFNTISCTPDATSFTNTETGLNNLGGRIGQIITIAGSSFGTVANGSQANCAGAAGTGCLQIGGYTIPDANIGTWSATSIDFTIPAAISVYGATITVIAASVSDASPLNFKIYPDITAISPSGAGEAREGDTITITGTRFGATQGVNKVTIDGVAATIIGWSDVSISATVPLAINDANNSVTVRAYQGTGGDNAIYDDSTSFIILPSITSITVPTAASDAAREYSASDSDGIITVSGRHFGASGTVTVLGQIAAQVTTGSCVGSAYQATCVGLQVPASIADNSYTGNIVITRSDTKIATFAGFRILPRIISIAPLSDVAGASLTVTGNHFCQAGSANCPSGFSLTTPISNVKFGVVDATSPIIWNWTNTGADVRVPVGSGSVAVKLISGVGADDYESNTADFSYASLKPADPLDLKQFESNGITEITPIGSGTNDTNGIILRADSAADIPIRIILEFEVKQNGIPFDGTITAISAIQGPGIVFNNIEVASPIILPDQSYHWQVRAKNYDNPTEVSNWVPFGGNPDFVIDTTGPAIGGVAHSGVTDIQATIIWNTGIENTNQQVAYGIVCPVESDDAVRFNLLTKVPSSPNGNSNSHTVILSGLTASTNYVYMVRSADAFGNPSFYPLGTCNTFSTTAPQTRVMKTLEFYIEQSIAGASSFNKTFDTFISESKTNRSNIKFQSVMIEIFGVSTGGLGNITVGVNLNGAPLATDYTLADPGANSTYWTFDHYPDPNSINFDCINCTDVSNNFTVNVSGAASTSLLGAKAIITYYYEPL